MPYGSYLNACPASVTEAKTETISTSGASVKHTQVCPPLMNPFPPRRVASSKIKIRSSTPTASLRGSRSPKKPPPPPAAFVQWTARRARSRLATCSQARRTSSGAKAI